MTRVLLTTLRTALSAPEPIQSGTIRIEYRVGTKRFDSRDSRGLILSYPIEVKIIDGAPAEPIELEPTAGSSCVLWRVDTREGRSYEAHTEIPSSAEPIEFAALPKVDPFTFEPVDVTPSLNQTIDSRIAQYLEDHPGSGGGGGGGLIEDPENPGFYIPAGGMAEDPSNPGFYIP